MTLNEVSQLRVGSKMGLNGRVCYLVLPTDYPYSIMETKSGVKYVPLTTTLGSGIMSTKLTKENGLAIPKPVWAVGTFAYMCALYIGMPVMALYGLWKLL